MLGIDLAACHPDETDLSPDLQLAFLGVHRVLLGKGHPRLIFFSLNLSFAGQIPPSNRHLRKREVGCAMFVCVPYHPSR